MNSSIHLKPIVLSVLLFLTATLAAQPRELAEVSNGLETKDHYYYTIWVCTGDTLDTDTTESIGTLYEIDGFWIMCQEMTQELWEWYMQSNPSTVRGEMLPVNNVNREAADSLCSKIQERIHQEWRLPTEKEWRFAYNGGIFSEGYQHSGSDHINLVGWTAHNSGKKLHEGGKLIPNELGIYDMDGNIAEIVTDGENTLYAGRSYRHKVIKAHSPFISKTVEPECCGVRLVWHQPLWFNKYVERVFR